MAGIPTGYDPSGLSPKIEILDEADSVQHTYESDAIDASPTQDFDLESWNLHRGVNTDHGNLVFEIDDPNKDLLDLTDARRESKIIPTWKVKFSLGKNSGNINEWFRGNIVGIDLDFPNTVDTKHRIFVVGEGRKTADIKTVMRYFQERDVNDDLIPTDTSAKLSELYKRLLQNTDHRVQSGPDLGFTVNGVQDIDVKIPDFQKNYESIGQALNELAGIAGAYYGIDLGDAYLRRRDSVSSGFLITNMDNPSIIKDNWDQTKVAYLHNAPRGWSGDYTDFGVGFFNGQNIQKTIRDQEQTSANASLDLSALHHSFEFIPSKDNVLKIAPHLGKIGTITKDLTIKLMGDDGAGKPNPNDVRVTRVIKGAKLQDELASSKYLQEIFNKFSVVPGTKIHVVFDKFLDAVNYPELDYQTGSGTYHDSTDGITWTARTGNVKFKEFASKTTPVLVENTVTTRKFPGLHREINVPMAPFKSTDMALLQLSAIAVARGKQRRRYPQFLVSAPTTPFGLAKTLRIMDSRSGLDFSPNLIAYDLGGGAYDKQNNMGATELALTVEEWGY